MYDGFCRSTKIFSLTKQPGCVTHVITGGRFRSNSHFCRNQQRSKIPWTFIMVIFIRPALEVTSMKWTWTAFIFPQQQALPIPHMSTYPCVRQFIHTRTNFTFITPQRRIFSTTLAMKTDISISFWIVNHTRWIYNTLRFMHTRTPHSFWIKESQAFIHTGIHHSLNTLRDDQRMWPHLWWFQQRSNTLRRNQTHSVLCAVKRLVPLKSRQNAVTTLTPVVGSSIWQSMPICTRRPSLVRFAAPT